MKFQTKRKIDSNTQEIVIFIIMYRMYQVRHKKRYNDLHIGRCAMQNTHANFSLDHQVITMLIFKWVEFENAKPPMKFQTKR